MLPSSLVWSECGVNMVSKHPNTEGHDLNLYRRENLASYFFYMLSLYYYFYSFLTRFK
jgi:hypothetical protein